MKKRYLVGLFVCLFAVACQPNVAFVEVTRLVTVEGGELVADSSPADTAVPIEVTRIVNQEVTRVVAEEVVVEVTKSPLGSEERPVQVLIPPVVNTAVITTRGEPLVQALTEATGQQFAVGIPDDTQPVFFLLGAGRMETIGFFAGLAYARPANSAALNQDWLQSNPMV
jgi:ABC-type phosphate/phosphonate transport system substrate-binding protein